MSLQEYFNYNINFNTSNSLILGQATVASIFTPGSGMLTHTVNTIGNMFMTGGNIGIGTTAPSSLLHLSSSSNTRLNLDAPLANNSGFSIRSGGVEKSVIWRPSNTDDFAIWINGISSNALYILSTNGNVGINTNAPAFKLDVSGTGRFTNIIITGGNLNATFNSNTIGNIITTGGNVGIGTVAPSYPLDVSGTGRFTNILSTTSTMTNLNITDTTVAYGFSSAASIISAGGAAFRNMWLAGAAGSSTGNTPNQFTPLVLGWNSGNSQIAFQRSDGGANTIIMGVNSQSQFFLQNNAGVGVGGLFFQTSNARPMYFTGGNVGIGTSNPSYAFDVVGTVNINTSLTTGALYSTNQTTTNIVATNLTTSNIAITGGSLNATFNSNTIANLFTTGGNIGIGTTSPNGRLAISSGTTVGNLSIDTLGGVNDGFSYVGFNGYNDSAGSEIRINTNKLRWRLATDQRTTSDNIMIDAHNGTSFPYILRFQVGTQGNVKLNTAGEARYHLYNNAGVSEWLFGQKSSTRSDFTISKLVASTETDYLTITTGGNVGISTTSPIARFHLDTTPTAASYGIWNGSATLSANQQLLQFIGKDNALRNGFWNWYSHAGDNNTSNNLRWDVNGMNSVLSLSAVGRVGILTTNQAYTLDVNGTIRSTGDIFIGDGTNAEALNLWDVPGAAWQLSTGNYNLNIRNGTVGSTMVDRVTITSIGNVGIGITTPQVSLHVGNGQLQLGPSNTGGVHMWASNSGLAVWRGTWGAGIAAFCSDSRGNFGIGTHTPTDLLHISNGNLALSSDAGVSAASKGFIINQASLWGGLEVEGNPGTGAQILNMGVNTNRSKTWNSSYNGGWFRVDTRGGAGIPLFQWYKKDTGGTETMMACLQSTGNFGIGTSNPAFTLDVNGTIARSGVKLPRYDNGSFSGAASFSIPILFNDTQYNYAEFRVRYVTSAICNINISATSYVNAAMTLNECALTTVKWNAQSTPVYATFTNTASGIFADTVETVGIDNNLIFRIARASGTSTAGIRNHYTYDNVYCWAGTGTARGYGQGHIDCASVGGSPLQYVTFTCSTGTVSGTYSSVHYY